MGHRTKQKATNMGKVSVRKKGNRQKWGRNERDAGRGDRTHVYKTQGTKLSNEQNISE